MAGFWKRRIFRNVARKPVSKIENYLKYGFVITEHECYCCPACRKVLNAGPDYQPRYCSQCGQKINFSGVAWKRDVELGYMQRRDGHEPF
ncbi:hypothetical protein E5329_23870 [Petralouisia muris]|uniref:Uncharacterized protein n=1 Tax=Petralouisia muris TaxID=3032872 RepID=A0AC61RPD8_9FIRM|nr:hypothetical protein [Petralouisia muris]TGY90879.1 hypothetical protein E5329_23870 [Petralouisia muris]